jgi:hypothetical protein
MSLTSYDITPMGGERATMWYAVANGVTLQWTTRGEVELEARGVLGSVPPSEESRGGTVRGVQLVDVETGKVVATQLVMDMANDLD